MSLDPDSLDDHDHPHTQTQPHPRPTPQPAPSHPTLAPADKANMPQATAAAAAATPQTAHVPFFSNALAGLSPFKTAGLHRTHAHATRHSTGIGLARGRGHMSGSDMSDPPDSPDLPAHHHHHHHHHHIASLDSHAHLNAHAHHAHVADHDHHDPNDTGSNTSQWLPNSDKRQVRAYGKLEFPFYNYFIRTLSITLGRTPKNASAAGGGAGESQPPATVTSRPTVQTPASWSGSLAPQKRGYGGILKSPHAVSAMRSSTTGDEDEMEEDQELDKDPFVLGPPREVANEDEKVDKEGKESDDSQRTSPHPSHDNLDSAGLDNDFAASIAASAGFKPDVDLGQERHISRDHARLFWDHTGMAADPEVDVDFLDMDGSGDDSDAGFGGGRKGSLGLERDRTPGWVIEVRGSNGVLVDKTWHARGEKIRLARDGRKTCIQIADRVFYFVLPNAPAAPSHAPTPSPSASPVPENGAGMDLDEESELSSIEDGDADGESDSEPLALAKKRKKAMPEEDEAPKKKVTKLKLKAKPVVVKPAEEGRKKVKSKGKATVRVEVDEASAGEEDELDGMEVEREREAEEETKVEKKKSKKSKSKKTEGAKEKDKGEEEVSPKAKKKKKKEKDATGGSLGGKEGSPSASVPVAGTSFTPIAASPAIDPSLLPISGNISTASASAGPVDPNKPAKPRGKGTGKPRGPYKKTREREAQRLEAQRRAAAAEDGTVLSDAAGTLDPIFELDQIEKPPFTYPSLIAQALCALDEKKGTLASICEEMMRTWKYFESVQTASANWQNTVKHNLTSNVDFVRIPAVGNSSLQTDQWTLSDQAVFDGKVLTPRVTEGLPASTSTPSATTLVAPQLLAPKPATSSGTAAANEDDDIILVSSTTPASRAAAAPSVLASAPRIPPAIAPRPSPTASTSASTLTPAPSVSALPSGVGSTLVIGPPPASYLSSLSAASRDAWKAPYMAVAPTEPEIMSEILASLDVDPYVIHEGVIYVNPVVCDKLDPKHLEQLRGLEMQAAKGIIEKYVLSWFVNRVKVVRKQKKKSEGKKMKKAGAGGDVVVVGVKRKEGSEGVEDDGRGKVMKTEGAMSPGEVKVV